MHHVRSRGHSLGRKAKPIAFHQVQKIFLSLLAISAFASVSHSQIAVVTGNGPATSTPVDFTVSGFGTPDAAILFVAESTGFGTSTGEWVSVGINDFTGFSGTQAVHVQLVDNVNDTDTETESSSSSCIGPSGTLYVMSAITDGVRLSIGGISEAYECMVWLVKGDNVEVLELTTPSTLNGTADFWQSSASQDWLPDTAIVICPEPSVQPGEPLGGVGNDATISIGFADWADSGGTVTQCSYFLGELDSEIEVATDETTLGAAVELSDINTYAPPAFADIHMTTRNAAEDLQIYALIVDWPSTVEHEVRIATGPTSTGTWKETAGFDIDFVGMIQTNLTATDLLVNNNTSGTFGMFAWQESSASGGVLTLSSEYSSDPTDTHVTVDDNFLLPFHNGDDAMIGAAYINSFPFAGSTQFAVNFTTVDSAITRGRKWPMLIIGD